MSVTLELQGHRTSRQVRLLSHVGTPLSVLSSRLQHEVMSSDSDSEDHAEEKQRGEEVEKEEVGDNQPARRPRKEQPGQDRSSQPDHSGMQQGTLGGGPVEVQREEVQVQEEGKRIAHIVNVNQQRQDGGPVRSAPLGERHLRRCVPRRSLTCSYPDRDREQQAEEPRGPGPFYYFGGANGAEIVSCYCESRGWKRIYNKNRVDFKLKWCETKSPVNYCSFREGEQLVYQIPNNKVLTTKIGLLSSLREYERVSSKVHHGQGLREDETSADILAPSKNLLNI